ncbi:MAG: alcohol dehydrogenase catalytic domain-containing protein [Clostridia bacterium]
MKIALLMGANEIKVQEQPKPVPGIGEVRLKVEAAGICGTDIDAYKGKQPRGWTITYPFRMGHELAGTVDAIGEGVSNVKVGDRVVPDGRIPCGYCSECRSGHVNACNNGGYTSGGFMEYSIYSYKSLVKIPDSLDFAAAAFAEPLSCCLYGSSKLDVKVGDFAVVIGEGAIGILHAQILQRKGAEVAIVGLIPERLAVAKSLGINHIINAKEEDVVAKVMELSGGKGSNVTVCAAGAEVVLAQALDIAARYGQILYFAATLKEKVALDLDLLHYKELRMIGSYDSTTAFYEQAVHLLALNLIKVDKLLTHKFKLDDAAEAFQAAQDMIGLKVMIFNEN